MDYLDLEEITENLVSFFTMAAGWTKDETQALIKIRGDANVQSQLDGVQRNRTIRTVFEMPSLPLQSSNPGNLYSSTLRFPPRQTVNSPEQGES